MKKIFTLIFLLTIFPSLNSVVLNCEYSFERWLITIEKYSCVTTLSEVSTNQRLTGVNGNHLENKNHSNVESIEIIDCTGSTFIPRNMLNFFPNLIGIRLVNCGTLILSGNELNEYNNLSLFAIESTKVERIPGNFFSTTPQISVIGFADNSIKYVGSKLLTNLTNLSWVSFHNNECISQTATTRDEISVLIESLITSCVDILEVTTTTTITTSSTESSENPTTTTTTEMAAEAPNDGRKNPFSFIFMINILILMKLT